VDTYDVVVPGGSRLRFRPSRAVKASFIAIVAMDVFLAIMSTRRDFWPPMFMGAVLTLEYSYLCFSVGITLTADTAIVHSFHRRKIKWADIQCVQIEKYMGNRTIAIYEADGCRTRLRAPVSGFLAPDDRFEEKFHTIGRWWLSHRGTDWTEGPRSDWLTRAVQVSGTPVRIRPAGSQAGPILLALAWLGSETVFSGMLSFPGADPTAWSRSIAGVVLAVIISAMWYFGVHAGVTLTPDHLAVHNLRRRRLPWSEISSVTVERTWRGSRLVVREVTGRRIRLSGPRIGLLLWNRRFEETALAVHAWWCSGLEVGKAEGPVDAPAPLEFAAPNSPRLWKRVLVALVCLALGYRLLIGLLVTALLTGSS